MSGRAAAGSVLALLVALPLAAAYPDPGAVPRYHDSPCFESHQRRFVHDYVGLMDPREAAAAEHAACQLYLEDSAHLVLVVVADAEGESVDRYAVHLFEAWGIGREAQDDGLLLLYVADDGTGQGALRIEVGYGLEGVVNSLVARDAYEGMAAAKRSRIENGSTEQAATANALAAGTIGLATFVRANHAGDPAGEGLGTGGFPWQAVAGVVAVLLLVLLLGSRGRRRRGLGMGGLGGLGGYGMGRWGGRGGGGFGGGGGGWGGGRGGGGGFGGGRSGGGGGGGRF